jgi:hypothetical protein
MAVNHDLGEVFLAKQKVFADPQQVFLPLVRQWNSRLDASVHEQEITAGEERSEAAQKLSMRRRQCRGQCPGKLDSFAAMRIERRIETV